MSEETNQTPEPNKADRAGQTVFWLLFAFVPGLVSIPLMRARSDVSMSLFMVLAGACSLCSGFGVFRRVESQLTRILLGLFLAGFFFVVNVFIVILVGCSNIKM